MYITSRLRAPSGTWEVQRLTWSATWLLVLLTLFSLSHVLGSPQIVAGFRHDAFLGEIGSKKMGLGMSSLLGPQEIGVFVEHEEDSTVNQGGSVQEEGNAILRNRRADPPVEVDSGKFLRKESGATTGEGTNDPKTTVATSDATVPPSENPPVSTIAPTDPPAVENATSVSTTPDPTTTGPPGVDNATSAATTAAPPPSASPLISNANISTIYDKNYSYIDQTTFVTGMNGWDFEGIWLKSNLETMAEGDRPVPLPYPPTNPKVEGGSTLGGALQGLGQDSGQKPLVNATNVTSPDYVNNYVIIDYSFLAGGTLRKVFKAMDFGEVFLSYYVIDDTTRFKLSLDSSALQQPQVLYDDVASNPRYVGQWVVRSFNFTANLSLDYALVLTVEPPATPSGDRKPLLAVHHIAVGGNLSDSIIIPPPGGSNATIIPPGAMEPIREIANAIWTALYVFLAFFLLSIVAVIVLIMKGRCR